MTVNLKNRIVTSIFLILLTILILSFDFLLIYTLIVLGVISILEFLSLTNKIFKNKKFIFIFNFFFITYISLFSFFFIFFSNFVHLKIIIFSLLIACIGSDIGGYIVGKYFKGPKLTKISPNKTISGSIGSFVFSSVLLSLFIFYFTENLNFKFILIGLITSLFCQFGDLIFSFLKRKAKLKDTGNILPGHGGVLDRIDGILIGIPFGFLSIILLF